MADFSATDVAFSGIQFVRERPRTVAIWAGAQLVISLIVGAAIVAIMGPSLAQLQGFGRPPTADPAQAMAVLGRVMPMLALALPVGLHHQRPGLRDRRPRRAAARATKAWATFASAATSCGRYCSCSCGSFVFIGAEICGLLVVLVPTLILTLIAKTPGGAGGILFGLAVFAALIYGIVRLSLSSAMTFDKKRVELFASWALTKGQFWNMLGAYAW